MRIIKKSFQILVFLLYFSIMSSLLTDSSSAQIGENAIKAGNCHFDRHDKAVYKGETVSVNSPSKVKPGELFETEIKIKNLGNMPWFSSNENCDNIPFTFLGTDKEKDRVSPFHAPGIFGETAWYDSNRIIMKTARVNPGEVAEFVFVSHAPFEEGIFREFFSPVIEGESWIKLNDDLKIDIMVGSPSDEKKLLKHTMLLPFSGNLLDDKWHGEKKIIIKISTQRMKAMIGDNEIANFPISTGTWRTPTPLGTTKIISKQEVRVASARPHYIMPKFMMFRAGGYGIHALPSLANDRGVYWREALNHIGTRRSHGCVRLLPADADFMYDFSDIGTVVTVIP